MLIDGGGGEALVWSQLVDRDDLTDIEPGAAAGRALVEDDALFLKALHGTAAAGAVERREGLAARAAGFVGLEAAVTCPAAARGHGLFKGRVSGAGVGHTAGERIADRPEAVAACAEPERVDRLEFEPPEGGHFRVIGAVGTAGLGVGLGAVGGVTPEVGEDRIGIAFPGARGGAGAGARQPAVVGGSGHRERIGGSVGNAQRRSLSMPACRLSGR